MPAAPLHLAALHGPEVTRRLHQAYGWPTELIGSSHFLNGVDVDVVLTVVGCETLADAYARVVEATGWHMAGSDEVSGHRVVSLHGQFEGHLIDAQVWRGEDEADTHAEGQTRAALAHTARLLDGTCARCRQSIALFHEWAGVASVKGAQLAMPPGVAWTVAATMLWQLCADWDDRSDAMRLKGLLTSFAAVLRTRSTPCIALGCPVACATVRAASTCEAPLCILLDGLSTDLSTGGLECAEGLRLGTAAHRFAANLCERMCIKTTRALLMTVEYALSLPVKQRLLPKSYEAMRESLLPVAAVVHPRTPDAVPRTLHRILRGIDSYEVVETVLASVCPHSGAVRLHVRVDPFVSATKYGLHPKRHELVDVRCERGGCWLRLRYSGDAAKSSRVWALHAHASTPVGATVHPWPQHKESSTTPVEGPEIGAWWRFEAPSAAGGCVHVPNVAHLEVDLSSRFESRWWRKGELMHDIPT